MSASVALPPAEPTAESAGLQRIAGIVAVLAAMAMVVLDASMVNIAVPTLAANLAVPPSEALRVVSVYQTALLMALLPCAALGGSFGNRRIFMMGVALFAVASIVAASVTSLTQLLVARFLQGLGGAAIMALGVALLRQILPPNRIGAAIGWNALTVALCSAGGPSLGALVISLAGWHWLPLVHLPLAMIAFGATMMVKAMPGTGRAPDLVSMLLCVAAFASLMFGAEALASKPALACLLLGASAVLFWKLVRREQRSRSPLIPLDLLRLRPFSLAVVASICCFTGQVAAMLSLPFHLQHAFRQTPLATGLYMTSWPLSVALAALVAGRLSDRWPSWLLCAAGATLIALGLVSAAMVPAEAGPVWLAVAIIPCGVGFGLFQVPNNRTMFLTAPVERSAAAGGMQGTARLTGQTMGAVLITLLFALAPTAEAPIIGMVLGAAFAVLAAGVSALHATDKGEEHRG